MGSQWMVCEIPSLAGNGKERVQRAKYVDGVEKQLCAGKEAKWSLSILMSKVIMEILSHSLFC